MSTPQPLPAALIQGYTAPTPDKVPGFEAAKAAHQLPEVPTTPPTRLPGVSANGLIMRGIILLLALFIVGVIIGKSHLFGPLNQVIAIILIFGAFGQIFWMIRLSQKRAIQECKTGYTTSQIITTSTRNKNAPVTWTRDSRGYRTRTRQARWNFAGVWWLKNDGSVRRAPDTQLLAPGYYPSPNRQGSFELWTGFCWDGYFQDTPQ